MNVIETINLQKHYQIGDNSVLAVDGIDLNVKEGEFVCISGRSGSGKSTLLSLLAGLESPTGGEVRLLGQHLEEMNEQNGDGSAEHTSDLSSRHTTCCLSSMPGKMWQSLWRSVGSRCRNEKRSPWKLWRW